MNALRASIIAAAAVLSLEAGVATGQSDQTLSVTESDETYRLSVPVSRLVMTIPKGSLVASNIPRRGSATSSRYFMFEDRARGLAVSGWFEPAAAFTGIEAFWRDESETSRRNGLPPRDVSMSKVGAWDAIVYDIDFPRGSNTHIRAEHVAAGTWIDLHISVTTEEPIGVARETAMNFLRGIEVTAKD